MDQYKDLISKALSFFEELAKKTETPWDDHAAAAACAIFEKFFGDHVHDDVRFKAAPLAAAVAEEVKAKALPVWLLPLIISVIQTVLENWKKK